MKSVVLIEWDDASMNNESHWTAGDPPTPCAAVVFSTGFVANRTPKYITLVQSVAEGCYAHLLVIPRAMIRSITTLEAKKRPLPQPVTAPEG